MYSLRYFMIIGILLFLSIIDAKRRVANRTQNNLGDFCVAGTCASLNSNCKRVSPSMFRCVCKDQYLAVNKTHCVRVLNASIDSTCSVCIERGGVCLDEDSDDHMDKCFCQQDNDLCNEQTTTPVIPTTEPIRQPLPIVTATSSSRPVKRGEFILGLYSANQQRTIANGGSVFIGDRISIDIKFLEHNSDHHQIIAENCSISSSVSDNDIKLEKIFLLKNRCPSLDPHWSVRFQRIDPDHIRSTTFQIQKFETTSVVYLRCSIGVCYGRIENCQERLCPETRRSSGLNLESMRIYNSSMRPSTDLTPFDYDDDDGGSVIALKRRKRDKFNDEGARKNLVKLISDLSLSMDKMSSTDQIHENKNNNDHYEIRQVQQQFTIEIALAQPTQKSKPIYDSFYGRTSLSTHGAIERSTVIATISIIFIIGISISLFVVYRMCYTNYGQRMYGSPSFAGFGNNAESVYGGLRSNSNVCRYDMGRRSEQRFDESFFVSNVEPLGAYRRQY